MYKTLVKVGDAIAIGPDIVIEIDKFASSKKFHLLIKAPKELIIKTLEERPSEANQPES